jgi:hypothetical protein
VAIKELAPDGKSWATRWIDAYCPRGFTSIRSPDPTLDNRSIKIPLVRTADAVRGNRDPADPENRPCDFRQLTDDLWAAALELLPEAAKVWTEMAETKELVGRAFEPWRAVIAVARLFERHGVKDLEARMLDVMRAYQQEKADANTGDRAVQVLKAILFEHLGVPKSDVLDLSGVSDVLRGRGRELKIQARELSEAIKNMGESEEWDTEWATPRAVGWQLRTLRFEKDRDTTSTKGTRLRVINTDSLISLFQAYQVVSSDIPPDSDPPPQNVRNVRTAPASARNARVTGAATRVCRQRLAATLGGRSVGAGSNFR